MKIFFLIFTFYISFKDLLGWRNVFVCWYIFFNYPNTSCWSFWYQFHDFVGYKFGTKNNLYWKKNLKAIKNSNASKCEIIKFCLQYLIFSIFLSNILSSMFYVLIILSCRYFVFLLFSFFDILSSIFYLRYFVFNILWWQYFVLSIFCLKLYATYYKYQNCYFYLWPLKLSTISSSKCLNSGLTELLATSSIGVSVFPGQIAIVLTFEEFK